MKSLTAGRVFLHLKSVEWYWNVTTECCSENADVMVIFVDSKQEFYIGPSKQDFHVRSTTELGFSFAVNTVASIKGSQFNGVWWNT
jgi:hypothetical protein